jgi:hypothetical protein
MKSETLIYVCFVYCQWKNDEVFTIKKICYEMFCGLCHCQNVGYAYCCHSNNSVYQCILSEWEWQMKETHFYFFV